MFKNIVIVLLLAIITAGGLVAVNNPQIKSAIEQMLNEKGMQSEAHKVPDAEALKSLVKENMKNFAKSLKQKSMDTFYASISEYWKERTSVEALNKTFAPFIQNGIDLTALEKMQPIINKVGLTNKDKDLVIVGQYNATNAVVAFKQTCRMEGKEWKLVEFFVQIDPKK